MFEWLLRKLGLNEPKPTLAESIPRLSNYYVKEDTDAAKEQNVEGILCSTITVFHDGQSQVFLGDPLTEQIRLRDVKGVDLTSTHRPKQSWYTAQSMSKILLPFQIK